MSKELINKLRRQGLSNGTSLGRHDGMMDAAADEIERLQQEKEQLWELVVLAVEDMTENYKCHICRDHRMCIKMSSPRCGLNYSNFTWRHADKLKELGAGL